MAALPDRNRLHVLCGGGKLKQIKDLLNSDPNATKLINEPAGVFGFTPLHEAVSSRNADILRVLLTYGGRVDALSNGRYTPLHIAASIGDVECIKVLLDFTANLLLTDEFGKTPYATAQLNRRSKAARMLKTAEIKFLAMNDHPQLRSIINGLQRGRAVEEKCFEEALELAVESNHVRSVGYLVLHGARNVEQCIQAALAKPALAKTAVLLLLCHAAKTDDKDLVSYICRDLKSNVKESFFDKKSDNLLTRKFLPGEWNNRLTGYKLTELRVAARSMNMAFPVAIAFNANHFQVSRIILFEMYCNEKEGAADWHGLALSHVLPDWILEKLRYKKLILSHNRLTAVPKNVERMENLLRLDLSKNNILEVPRSIFELGRLRNLNLSSNEIGYLPHVVNWSKAMKVLNLSENNLRFLDASISQSELESLNVADNNLSHVQSCICDVKTLQSLDISRNKNITILPPGIAKLPKLNFLGIKEMDQITDPPLALRATTSLLLRHLKARLRSSVEYYTMKLMIVGLANRGKTTLMHRINKDYAFKDNQSTKGVDIRDIVIQRATFKCWDFAGQGEYYATHQCFLSQRSLYMLVWNLVDDEEGIEGLRPWLANLQSRVPKSSVIIVGTHLDKAAQKPGFNEEEIVERVYKVVRDYKEIHCQREMILAVTCSIDKPFLDECKRRTERLRALIYNVASQLTIDGQTKSPKVLGEMIPSSYLTLSKMITEKQAELNREGRLPLLRKSQFQNMVAENARNHPNDYFDPEDSEMATRFLHDIGIILHYNDPNQDLRDLYFISPSWLCDLMARIVTVKEAHSFIREGILRECDIQHIIKGEDKKFPQEFYPKYLRLLARFQIACRIDKERILVPSRLPHKIPANIPPLKEPRQIVIRLHRFSCIPHGFWSRFISRFLLYLNDMLNVTGSHTGETDEGVEVEEDEENESDQEDVSDTQWHDERWERERDSEKATPGPQETTESHPPGNKENDSTTQFKGKKATEIERDATDSPVKMEACFLINGLRFQDESDSSAVSSAWQDSRKATPIHDGGLQGGSQMSPIFFDESRPNSSQGFERANLSRCDDDQSIASTTSNDTDDSLPKRGATSGPSFVHSTEQDNTYDWEDDHFFEAVDISTYIDRQQLICWRYGVVFNHPKLFLSVTLKEGVADGWIVETKVCKSLLGYRALAFTVDHIRTLIKEWFPGLEGTDGFNAYVEQLVPCPVCISSRINPPHEFQVTECLKESFAKEFMVCENTHIPQVVEISALCPDLFFMDLEPSMQLAESDLLFLEADDNMLGQGQFGKVYRGTYKDHLAAIKLFNFKVEVNPDLAEALDNFYEVRQEAVVLSRVGRHPYVITFYGVAVRPKLCLAIELATNGTLKDVLRRPYHMINRIVVYRIAQQISSAVTYLHSLGIIHRDLKSDNVLLFSLEPDVDINIKLADFGTANFISPVGLKFFTGTPGFIAPEIFEYSRTEEYDSKVDVFSYAMVLYELISKRRPFYDCESAIEVNNALREGKRPIFYKIKQTNYSLLTLTELMVKIWAQEAVNRPSSLDITRQLKSPSFCLLYGKTPLLGANTARLLCCVKSRAELWVTCDDRTGASVLIVDVETTDMKEKFVPENKCLAKAKEDFFNISSIHEIDKDHVAIILRSTSDYVSIYSSEKKKLVSSFPLLSYIRSLAVHSSFVILGREDGFFERVGKKDFLRGKWRDKGSVVVNEKRTVSALAISERETPEGLLSCLLVGCDKYVYKYPLMFDDGGHISPGVMTRGNEKYFVSQLSVSEDGRLLFVACRGSSIIKIFSMEALNVVGEVDCAKEIKSLKPGSDQYDQRVTCFCLNLDTIWIGTGSGHILIYEIYEDKEPALITWLIPYKLEVRSMAVCPNPGDSSSRLIVTIGKEVNPNALCYGADGLCLLTGAKLVDQSDPSNLTDRQESVRNHSREFEKQILLMWDGVGAAVMKKVVDVQ